MKIISITLWTVLFLLMSVSESKSFAPQGRDFGLGLMAGEPSGLTAKIWTYNDRAFALSLGSSYLGSIRVGVDYLWHFNAFNSKVVNMYAGPGVAIGIGESGGWWYSNRNKTWYKENDDLGFGVRGLVGINIVPRTAPLEFFVEVGLMLGLPSPLRTNFEGALGFRYYF